MDKLEVKGRRNSTSQSEKEVGPLGANSDHLAKEMSAHLARRAEQQVTALRRGAASYLKLSGQKPPSSGAQIGSVFGFAKSATKKLDGPNAIGLAALSGTSASPLSSQCLAFISLPPFWRGSPLPPGLTIPGPTSAEGFSQGDPATGALDLLGVTYNDDTTSTQDSGFVYKQVRAELIVAPYGVPQAWTNPVLNVVSRVQLAGYTIGLGRGGASRTGLGLAWCMLRLTAHNASRGVFAEAAEVPVCRLYGPTNAFPYSPITTNFNQGVDLGVQLSVAPGDVVVVGVSAELYVGVSTDSDLWLAANFSPLHGLFTPAGGIRLQGVVGTC